MKSAIVQTIIVNYRTPHLTLRAARGAQKAMAGMSGEVTIIDNASQDGSAPFLMDAIQSDNQPGRVPIRVITSDVNGGFGAGVNLGIEAGMADRRIPDYFYLLNSDAFPLEDALSSLVETLNLNKRLGIAGSQIVGEDGGSHQTAFRFPGLLSEFEAAASFGPVSRLFKRFAVPMTLPRKEIDCDWLAGASMLIRHDVLDDIGTFDEAFFLYFEETDLCRRARLAGWRTRYVPASKVAHVGSASTGMQDWLRKPDYWLDSRLHYFVKNGGWTYAFLANLACVLGGLLHGLQTSLRGRPALGPLRLGIRQFGHMAGRIVGRKPVQRGQKTNPVPAFGRI